MKMRVPAKPLSESPVSQSAARPPAPVPDNVRCTLDHAHSDTAQENAGSAQASRLRPRTTPPSYTAAPFSHQFVPLNLLPGTFGPEA
ncbi:hypothetical protein BC826DRAFT_1033856 [Russula brevipes]|nr:hypothetical protein BC826DRAFT_1033856 [Russula brevipes]